MTKEQQNVPTTCVTQDMVSRRPIRLAKVSYTVYIYIYIYLYIYIYIYTNIHTYIYIYGCYSVITTFDVFFHICVQWTTIFT